MTRYQALRAMSFGPVTAGITAFMNWMMGVPDGTICIMHVVIEYDTTTD